MTLVGEAFNVAPSFFPIKKASALKKLRRGGATAAYRVLMFNDDATLATYKPKPEAGVHYVRVGIDSGNVAVWPAVNAAPHLFLIV